MLQSKLNNVGTTLYQYMIQQELSKEELEHLDFLEKKLYEFLKSKQLSVEQTTIGSDKDEQLSNLAK